MVYVVSVDSVVYVNSVVSAVYVDSADNVVIIQSVYTGSYEPVWTRALYNVMLTYIEKSTNIWW